MAEIEGNLSYNIVVNPWSHNKEIPWSSHARALDGNWDSSMDLFVEKGITFSMLYRLRGKECWFIGIVI
jgi:hypothetical protein